MALKLLCFLFATGLVAYYFYLPIPDNIEEKWKVVLLDATFRSLGHMANLAELLGIKHYMDVMMLLTLAEHTEVTSDEHVSVTDTIFNNVPVRLFISKKKTEKLMRANIYIHGGGWCLGSSAMKPYDLLARMTAQKLNGVVVSIDYRLAPKVHFPTQFEDVYDVVKYFLDKEILAKYSVDPKRVSISGDSAGGNLAAAVTQQLLQDSEVNVKIKIQGLIYPVLQNIDLNTPSYQDNGNMPLLSRELMVRFWSEYFTNDKALNTAMMSNSHISPDEADVFKFVNWSTLLPENLKKNHVYSVPAQGHSNFVKKYPGLLDVRASPLLVEDEKLKGLPITYIITCMYDVLRDDGVMYAARLKKAGVQVEHAHYDNTFHGIMLLNTWPFDFSLAHHITNKYLAWLDDNL
ncbi:arylacetamide deacetylase [Bombina bombina]|uniref:arylacetamide deacetylase n=1 Tax=Bombina bombina TaxID=8345 RepID=UPI00235AF2AB|nr:arylacetamide deacetylase [Bombina bombina]